MKAIRHIALLSWLCIPLLFASLYSCKEKKKDVQESGPPMIHRDLNSILESGEITLLTENSSSSYYLYKGQPMGYDYELVKKFADDMGLELKVEVIDDVNRMFELLNEGKGDIIACNLTVTNERRNLLNFSTPLMEVRQVLVQRKPDDWKKMNKRDIESSLIRSPIELGSKTVYVHEYSSFNARLRSLQDEIGQEIDIRLASGDVDSETLIRMVAEGLIDYTIADENSALLNQTYYPQLDVKTGISFPQQIALGTRLNSDSLRDVLDIWLSQSTNKRRMAFLYDKYFRSVKDQKSRVFSAFSSLDGRKISDYDEHIKRLSLAIGWDWRLVAALIYQESRFNPDAKSWAGAFGLMQLMPQTAERFGIDTTQTELGNLEAGVKYIKFLEGFWEDKIQNPEERRKFVLASYNVGPGHVLDAQKIADHLGLDRLIWDNNVADCIVLKSQAKYYHLEGVKHGYCRGEQPFAYVRNIMSHYGHLVQNID